MKKNKMMRIASVLLIAVLLTASVISGTFAKYVTSDNTGDKARVAKFGVVVLGEGSLFAKSYLAADDNTPGEKASDGKEIEELTVETSNGDKLVAPGTKNDEGMTISVIGTPEVDVRVTIGISNVKDVFLAAANDLPDMTTGKDAYFSNDEDYHPIVFTLAGSFVENNWKAIKDTVGFDDLTAKEKGESISGSLETILSILEEVFDDGIYVDANEDLSEVIGTLKLTWEWKFVQNENNPDKITDRDRKDTLLGDLAAYNEGDEISVTDLIPEEKLEAFEGLEADEEDWTAGDYNLTVSLKLTVTVTQVD